MWYHSLANIKYISLKTNIEHYVIIKYEWFIIKGDRLSGCVLMAYV